MKAGFWLFKLQSIEMALCTDRGSRVRILLETQRVLAALLFGGYGVWNVYWLIQAKIPPSIFLKVTGLPCPTTGGTRAMIQLWAGNWQESLRYNAMALPIVCLSLLSFGWLLCQSLRGKRLRLPFPFFQTWMALLGAAWVLKLTGDPMYW
jgi:hypothetical protein